MSAISRYQPLIIFDIDQLSDQSSKSEIKKGIFLCLNSQNFIVFGYDNMAQIDTGCLSTSVLPFSGDF